MSDDLESNEPTSTGSQETGTDGGGEQKGPEGQNTESDFKPLDDDPSIKTGTTSTDLFEALDGSLWRTKEKANERNEAFKDSSR